jgi:hypothetical protein
VRNAAGKAQLTPNQKLQVLQEKQARLERYERLLWMAHLCLNARTVFFNTNEWFQALGDIVINDWKSVGELVARDQYLPKGRFITRIESLQDCRNTYYGIIQSARRAKDAGLFRSWHNKWTSSHDIYGRRVR